MGKQSREKLARRSPACRQAGLGEGGWERPKFQSKTGPEKTCVFIIKWGTYLTLFIPLILLLQFFFPFVAPKTTIFRILIEIIFVAYLFLAFSNPKYRPRIDALTISLTVFLAVFIFASLTGINFSRSFWSTYERMTGIFTMLHLYVFFVILKNVFKKKEDWEKLLGFSIFAGILLSFYVLKGSEISTRGGGTIGNTSFLAAYLFFDIFFALILFLSNLGKRDKWPVFWQIFSGVSLLIMLPVLFTSTARGAITSFLLGLLLLLLGYLIFSGKKALKRIALVFILLSVLSAVSLLLIRPLPVEKEVKTTFREMKSRFVVWDAGIKGFLERPVFGWGPENFNAVFQMHFNPCMSLPRCGNEVWFDRVHNIVFDTLVATGVIGLASYLSIFLVAIYGLLRVISKITEKKNIFLPLGLIVILIAYFFQNLLVFDMINSYLVFFLTLAFAGFLMESGEGEKFSEKRNRPLGLIPALIIIILMLPVFWIGNVKTLTANRYIIKMVSSSNAQEFFLYFQKSLDTWMERYETREQAARKLINASAKLTNLSPEDQETFAKIYGGVEAEMEKSIQKNYLDFRHHLFLGELYLASYRVSGDAEKLARAEKVLEKAIELSPTNQQGYWLLTDVKLATGKSDEIIPILKKALELDRGVGRAHWYLALGYRIIGQYEAALEEVDKAEENGYNWRENTEDIQKVIDIYRILGENPSLVNKDSEKAIEPALKILEKDPNNIDVWMGLATAYANNGQYDKAREAAQKIIEINPDMAKVVEGFLKSLPKQ